MKTILQIVRIVGVLAVAFSSSPSRAQVLAASPPGSQAPASARPGLMLRVSDVLNAKVFSEKGEELGRIRDVLLDSKTGNISYAVLGTGGWQGIGEKLAIVPWDLIAPDEKRSENYILHTDVEKFRSAPTFDRDHWATAIQPDYLSNVQKHFAASSKPQQAKLPQPTPTTQSSQTAQTSQPTTPTPTPKPTQSEQQTAQKATPQPTPARQAEHRPRKESQVQMRPRHSSGSHGRIGTEDQGEKDDSESQWK